MKTEKKKLYGHFKCHTWKSNIEFLRSSLIAARLISPKHKSCGFCFIEVFESEEDAKEASPDGDVGMLEIEETVEEGDIK